MKVVVPSASRTCQTIIKNGFVSFALEYILQERPTISNSTECYYVSFKRLFGLGYSQAANPIKQGVLPGNEIYFTTTYTPDSWFRILRVKTMCYYLFFFLCLFFLKRFLRLCVDILCLFLFLPQGIFVYFLFWESYFFGAEVTFSLTCCINIFAGLKAGIKCSGISIASFFLMCLPIFFALFLIIKDPNPRI